MKRLQTFLPHWRSLNTGIQSEMKQKLNYSIVYLKGDVRENLCDWLCNARHVILFIIKHTLPSIEFRWWNASAAWKAKREQANVATCLLSPDIPDRTCPRSPGGLSFSRVDRDLDPIYPCASASLPFLLFIFIYVYTCPICRSLTIELIGIYAAIGIIIERPNERRSRKRYDENACRRSFLFAFTQ